MCSVLCYATLVFAYMILAISLFELFQCLSNFVAIACYGPPNDEKNWGELAFLIVSLTSAIINLLMSILLIVGLHMEILYLMLWWEIYAALYVIGNIVFSLLTLFRRNIDWVFFTFEAIFICFYIVTFALVLLLYIELKSEWDTDYDDDAFVSWLAFSIDLQQTDI